MNYEVIVYTICLFVSVFAVSGLNFENTFKKNKKIEAYLIAMLLSVSFAYLTGRFIIEFIEVSKIL